MKDKKYTYEELIVLYKEQEKYIKELENKASEILENKGFTKMELGNLQTEPLFNIYTDVDEFKAAMSDTYLVYEKHLDTAFNKAKKLIELEKIEKELKIDLLTVYKILTDGIYEKLDENEIFYVERPQIKIGDDGLGGRMLFVCYENEWRVSMMGLNIDDYGTMWAFTKEELEK